MIPNLLVKDVARAGRDSRAKRFYIGNIMTQPGETDGYSLEDHIRAIEAHLDPSEGRLFDYVVANTGSLPPALPRNIANARPTASTLARHCPITTTSATTTWSWKRALSATTPTCWPAASFETYLK